jgi:hypothetical protein
MPCHVALSWVDLAESKSEIFESRNFENFQSVKVKNSETAKIVSLDLAIERLFGAESLRTAKPRLNLLEGRARRRCFPSVARYPPS